MLPGCAKASRPRSTRTAGGTDKEAGPCRGGDRSGRLLLGCGPHTRRYKIGKPWIVPKIRNSGAPAEPRVMLNSPTCGADRAPLCDDSRSFPVTYADVVRRWLPSSEGLRSESPAGVHARQA
jgi:hypothetical protein